MALVLKCYRVPENIRLWVRLPPSAKEIKPKRPIKCKWVD